MNITLPRNRDERMLTFSEVSIRVSEGVISPDSVVSEIGEAADL